MRTSHCFTLEQLSVLLSGSGCDVLRGIGCKSIELRNEDVINSLNELCKTGALTSDGETFSMRDEIRPLIRALSEPSGYLYIRTPRTQAADLCCCFSDEILVCSRDSLVPELVRLKLTDSQGLCELVSRLLPENETELLPDETRAERFERERLSPSCYEEPIGADSPMLFNAERLDRDGGLLGSLRIIQMNLYTYIAFFDGKRTVRECYTAANTLRLFGRLL
ncbi:MAG: hypothetical protein IIU14_07005 [Ruminococcus sp.]|nr:hypothetical protein [Ruminococcus sp.]